MNYYQELLESYSKIKKRSFRLLEQEKTKKPKDKKAESDRPAAKPLAKDYVNLGVGTHPFQHPQAVDKDGAPLKLSVDKAESGRIGLQFGGAGSRTVRSVKEGEGETWYPEVEAAYATWFNQPGAEEKGDKGEEGEAAETPEQREERLKAESLEAIQDVLKNYDLALTSEGRLVPSEDTENNGLPESLDFWDEGDDKSKGEFINDVEEFLEKLQTDIEGDPTEKRMAVENLFDFLRVATTAKRVGGAGAITDEVSESIRKLYGNIAFTGGGQVVLNNKAENEIDKYGFFLKRDEQGRYKSNPELYKSIEEVRDRYNDLASRGSNPARNLLIPDLEVDAIVHSGTPIAKDEEPEKVGGKNKKANRGDTDEALWMGAGLLDKIIESWKPDAEVGEDQKWRIDLLKKSAEMAVRKLVPEKMAETFLHGNEEGRALFPNSPSQEAAEGMYDAVVAGLQEHWGSEFKDEASAKKFADTLKDDGVKAFATMLLMRLQEVKTLFGDVTPEYTVSRGGAWGNAYRLKVDTAFVFKPE